MLNQHLLSYILASPDVSIMNAIFRISQSILAHDFNLDCHVISHLQQADDPLMPGAIELSLPQVSGADRGMNESMMTSAGYLFLPIIQRLLTNATVRAEWPNQILGWQMPNFPSPGHVHSNTQRLLRKLASPQVTGNEVILMDKDRLAVQRLTFGQPLGAARCDSKLMVGQVQMSKVISRNRQVITLSPPTGKSRTLVVSNMIDITMLRDKTIAALVRPIRGRISYLMVAWSEPQRTLL